MIDTTLHVVNKTTSAIKADAGLIAFVADRVYGHVPKEATYPFVRVTCETSHVPFLGGNTEEVDFNHNLLIQVFSQYNGMKQVIEIRDAIFSLLNNNTTIYNLSGEDSDIECVSCVNTGLKQFLESDGKTYQAVAIFNVYVIRCIHTS
jgi:hypothetical protein